MRFLLMDPFNGAAGDMIIGSLLDLGADRKIVIDAMRSVVAEPAISTVNRRGIRALKVETNAEVVPRSLEEVIQRIAESSAPMKAKEMAERVFRRIERAERRVHGERTHFHEVGADDAVADVIGACTALFSLEIDRVAVLPVSLGRGQGTGAHGAFPIPAPATVEILREAGLQVKVSDREAELCTPTGAALLSEFATDHVSSLGNARIEATGYGAGTRDFPEIPNVLRTILFVAGGGEVEHDWVDLLETNVDDVAGEVVASTLTRLMEEGARDACAIPVVMKKGRPGYLVRALAHPPESSRIAHVMATELGSLGIRCIPSVHRHIITRTIEPVAVTIGGREHTIDIKVGWDAGKPALVKAEYEQVLACAREEGIPPREVKRLAEEVWWHRFQKKGEGRI